MNQQRNVLNLIGKTPLVRIQRLNEIRDVEILAKLESANPGGSIKDRPALRMIEEAEASGALTRDRIILEATSGNTGIGLALVAAVKGYRILLTMSESVSEERVKILKALGAEIFFTPAHLGTDGAIEHVYNLVREEPERYWLADQFNNPANWKAHYDGTALEIWEQTGGRLDGVVVALGTTGTAMGLSRRLKELEPQLRIIAVEPYMGHKIQGLKNMKESYQPGIFEKTRLDRIINIDDDEAFETARLLAKKEGLFVGMSSGAAMAAALRYARELKTGRIVVILPDGGERYLSTPLFTVKKKSGIRIYNTMTRQKEEFTPLREDQVAIYTCGPTLSQDLHIGLTRRHLVADLVRRYFEFKGYRVTVVMNLTDLDDRTIEGAEEARMALKDFTERHYRSFLDTLDRLGVHRATLYPKASEHVEHMIGLAQKLLEKGYAYEKFRSIYFDISRFQDYGRLSRIDLDKIHVGKTVDLDQYEKDNPRDFTLLKRSTLGELKRGIFYKTPWGNVRPSWHMECAAIALKHLGPTYDIHMSGIDLIFPHHENAVAIGYAVTGRPLANYWIHNEVVQSDPMDAPEGKSPEALTLETLFAEGYSGREIRYWFLSRHYRKPLIFSRKKLDAARNTLSNLDRFVQKLFACPRGPDNPETDQWVYDLRRGFVEGMDDDFSIAPALAALFQFTRRVNRMIDRRGLSPGDRDRILKALEAVNSVLGICELGPAEAEAEVERILREREKARAARDWKTADLHRETLLKMGIEVADTKEGPVWRRIS
jgi:cysteinyl-tRNA synthetase